MIKIEHLNKQYKNNIGLKDISVTFPKNETTVILGPSGAGKSTLLRSINYLEHPESGLITIDNDTFDFSKNLSTKQILDLRRKTAMVFQSWNLFPHLTILENITEGPIHVLKQDAKRANEEAMNLLKSVELVDTADRYPDQLSGGQQQRISICRAMAMHPSYLLFDEPTSALDPELEAQILRIMKNLANEDNSLIVVTHNMKFAQKVADKIIFLENGQVEFTGTSKEFFNNPAPRIKQFLEAMEF